MISYLTTLFLGKPPGGNLPVLSAHSFASNCQLALLESTEERNIFPRENVPDVRVNLGAVCIQADKLLTELTCPVILSLQMPNFNSLHTA